MHFWTMTIIENSEGEYRSQLKLWENTDGDIYIQVGYDDDDPYSTQGIAITKDDANALINELGRLIKQNAAGNQITLTQPLPNPQTGQLPLPSKVNWGK